MSKNNRRRHCGGIFLKYFIPVYPGLSRFIPVNGHFLRAPAGAK